MPPEVENARGLNLRVQSHERALCTHGALHIYAGGKG